MAVTDYSQRVFNQARRGSPVNPQGLPVALSNLVTAQARHESANFTSPLFLSDNNAFGYDYTGNANQVGPSLRSHGGNYYAKYSSLENSVDEIVDWIYRRAREGKFPANLATIQSPNDYATLLKNSKYFEDDVTNYQNGLTRWLTNYGTLAGGSLLALVGLAWVGWKFIKK